MFADERPQDVRLCSFSFSCSVLDQLYRWCIHRAAEALKLIRITDGPSTDTRSLESLSEASGTYTGTTPAIDFFDQLELYRTDKTAFQGASHQDGFTVQRNGVCPNPRLMASVPLLWR